MKWHWHPHVARLDSQQIDSARGMTTERPAKLRRRPVLETVDRRNQRFGVAGASEHGHSGEVASNIEQRLRLATFRAIARGLGFECCARNTARRREDIEQSLRERAREI